MTYHNYEKCSRILGACDFRTKTGSCRCGINDTNFGDKPCPFRKIGLVAAEKVTMQMLSAGKDIGQIIKLTGYTADDVEKIRKRMEAI